MQNEKLKMKNERLNKNIEFWINRKIFLNLKFLSVLKEIFLIFNFKFLIIAAILISFASFMILQFYRDNVNSISLLSKTASFNSGTIVSSDRLVDRLAGINKPDNSTRGAKPDKKTRKLSEFIIYLLSIMTVASDKSIILLFIMFMGLSIGFIKSMNMRVRDIFVPPPEMKFYKWWSLKFLSPLQKCIINRADEYDINPLRIDRRGTCTRRFSPHYVYNKQSAGFSFNEHLLYTNDQRLTTSDYIQMQNAKCKMLFTHLVKRISYFVTKYQILISNAKYQMLNTKYYRLSTDARMVTL